MVGGVPEQGIGGTGDGGDVVDRGDGGLSSTLQAGSAPWVGVTVLTGVALPPSVIPTLGARDARVDGSYWLVSWTPTLWGKGRAARVGTDAVRSHTNPCSEAWSEPFHSTGTLGHHAGG